MAMDYDKVEKLNLMATNNFMFEVMNLPAVSMFAQKFELPGVMFGRAFQPTPLIDRSIAGDKLEFEDFGVTFLVDEDLTNYREIWNWMMYLGYPRNTSQFKKMIEGGTEYSVRSDISVSLLTNKFNPKKVVKFIDCFPISLSTIEFSNNESEIVHPECTVTFDYSYFYFADDETLDDTF